METKSIKFPDRLGFTVPNDKINYIKFICTAESKKSFSSTESKKIR